MASFPKLRGWIKENILGKDEEETRILQELFSMSTDGILVHKKSNQKNSKKSSQGYFFYNLESLEIGENYETTNGNYNFYRQNPVNYVITDERCKTSISIDTSDICSVVETHSTPRIRRKPGSKPGSKPGTSPASPRSASETPHFMINLKDLNEKIRSPRSFEDFDNDPEACNWLQSKLTDARNEDIKYFNERFEQLKQQHKNEMNKMRREFKKDLSNLKSTHELEIENLKEQHDAEIKAIEVQKMKAIRTARTIFNEMNTSKQKSEKENYEKIITDLNQRIKDLEKSLADLKK